MYVSNTAAHHMKIKIILFSKNGKNKEEYSQIMVFSWMSNTIEGRLESSSFDLKVLLRHFSLLFLKL